MMSTNRRTSFIGGLIAGATLGAVVGLLLAPKPGKETRKAVGARAGEVQHWAGDHFSSRRARARGDAEPEPAMVVDRWANHTSDGG